MQGLLRAGALAAAMGMCVVPALAAEAGFDVGDFTAINISSGIDAIVTVGEARSVRAVSAHQEDLDELVVEVKDGTLHAGIDWNLLDFLFFGEREIVLHISVPSLERAVASSGADVEVSGMAADALTLEASSGSDLFARAVDGGSFTIDVSSGADLRVEGQCDDATIDVSSGGTLRAGELLCDEVAVEVSSGGDADVFARARITGEASSGGDIHVGGGPAERQVEESSGGEIAFSD